MVQLIVSPVCVSLCLWAPSLQLIFRETLHHHLARPKTKTKLNISQNELHKMMSSPIFPTLFYPLYIFMQKNSEHLSVRSYQLIS